MNERTEARVLFLASAAVAIFGVFAPFRWHDMPPWITNSALGLALFLLIWAVCLSIPAPAKGLKKLIASILIAGGMTALITGVVLYLDKSPSDQTKQKPTIEGMLTGGDSFCFLGLYYFDIEKNIARNTAIVRQGQYPLYDVRMRIFDMDTKEERNIYIGEISGGGTTRAVVLPGVWQLKDAVYYRIFFSARNGLWHQDLLLRKSIKENYWPAATRLLGSDGKVRHEDIDRKYVEEFGQPGWRP